MATVKLDLEGLDGNAFNLLGAFRTAAREQGWSATEIADVFAEATAGNYAHLVATLCKYIEPRPECK